MTRNWKLFLSDQEQGENGHSCCFYSTYYWKSEPDLIGLKRKKEKEIQVLDTGKEVIKLLLFADHMILSTENSEDLKKKKLLELRNEFIKVAG